MKTSSSLRLVPYLGLLLLRKGATAQEASSQTPVVITSVAYTTVTSYIAVDGGASSSITTAVSPTLTVTIEGSDDTTTTSSSSSSSTSSSSSSTTEYYTSTTSTDTTTTSTSTSTTSTSTSTSTTSSSLPSSTTTTTTKPTTATPVELPESTDASAYLHHAFPPTAAQPTWATGSFYTQLATALYAVDRSFAGRPDYGTIVAAISRAGDEAATNAPEVSASIAKSAWGWAAVTTNAWYRSDVPQPLQTEVAGYVAAWSSAAYSVLGDAQKAAATGQPGGDGGGGGAASEAAVVAPGGAGLRIMVGSVVGILVGVIGFM